MSPYSYAPSLPHNHCVTHNGCSSDGHFGAHSVRPTTLIRSALYSCDRYNYYRGDSTSAARRRLTTGTVNLVDALRYPPTTAKYSEYYGNVSCFRLSASILSISQNQSTVYIHTIRRDTSKLHKVMYRRITLATLHSHLLNYHCDSEFD